MRNRIAQQASSEAVQGNLGRWLTDNSHPGDTVFTESLGFIGYYVLNNRFIDWPGLASREVVPVIGASGMQGRFRQYTVVIDHFNPIYLALRQDEWDSLKGELQPRYNLCAEFLPKDQKVGGYVVACGKIR